MEQEGDREECDNAVCCVCGANIPASGFWAILELSERSYLHSAARK